MILGTVLTKNRVLFQTASPRMATMLKGCLAGNSTSINISPYGNRVDLTTEDKSLALSKNPARSFTYEELRGVIKKILLFGKMEKKDASRLLSDGRKVLDTSLSLFYPDEHNPKLEISFAYNWASIGIEVPDIEKTGELIGKSLSEIMGPSTKIMTNSADVISIHNYSMSGIYINHRAFAAITAILNKAGIISDPDKMAFVNKATEFGLKCTAFMEARQFSKEPNETFEIDAKMASPMEDENFFKATIHILSNLSRTGKFDGLDQAQLTVLHSLTDDPARIEKYAIPDNIKNLYSAMATHFRDEIKKAYASKVNVKIENMLDKLPTATSDGF